MPIRGRTQWPKVDPGYQMIPPKLTRSAGRPRTRRIFNSSEGGTGRKHKCKRCGIFGHLRKTWKEPEIHSDADRDATPPPKRQKSKKVAATIVSTTTCTPTKKGTEPAIATSSPMTRQRAAAIANTASPLSASIRSRTTAASPLKKI